ncbi:MAG: hypothetical protein WD749_06220, partial [Phycisphaerales bacterium]
MKRAARQIAVLASALALTAAVCTGCRGGRGLRAGARLPAAKLRALEGRIDAVPGRMLVIPVALEGAFDPRRPVRARLDDGRRLSAALSWVSVSPPAPGGERAAPP